MRAEAVIDARRAEPPAALFRCLSLGQEAADRVNVLAEDPSGRLWIGTDAGLYRLNRDSAGAFSTERVAIDDSPEANPAQGVSALLAEEDGVR